MKPGAEEEVKPATSCPDCKGPLCGDPQEIIYYQHTDECPRKARPAPRYRVEPHNNEGCQHCGHGRFYEVVSGHGDDEIAHTAAFGDLEHTQDICELMNEAFEAGRKRSE